MAEVTAANEPTTAAEQAPGWAESERQSVNGFVPQLQGKKRKIWAVLLILAAVLLILGVGAVFAKDAILRAVAPKLYVQQMAQRTIKQAAGEWGQMSKALGLPRSGSDTDRSVELKGKLDSVTIDDDQLSFHGLGVSLATAYNKTRNEVLMKGALEQTGSAVVSLDAYLNDEELGVGIPELYDGYWIMPAKTFGKAFNDSPLGRLADADISDDLDISLTALKEMSDLSITKETKQALRQAAAVLWRNVRLETIRPAEVTVDNAKVTARQIPVIIPKESASAYLLAAVDALQKDEALRRRLELQDKTTGADVLDSWDEAMEELKKAYQPENLKDFTIDLFEYQGRLIQMAVEYKYNGAVAVFTVRFGDTHTLINDASIELTVTEEDETMKVSLTSKGGHVPQGGKFSDDTSLVIETPYGDDIIVSVVSRIDLTQTANNLTSRLIVDADGEQLDIEAGGSMGNPQGFGFTLNDIRVQADDEEIHIKGELSYLQRSNDGGMVQTEQEKTAILELSETEWQTKGLGVMLKAYSLGQKLEKLFDFE